MIGQRLGPYEITAKLGEGGMGEVYRATDSRLKREVAIKVLPAAFTEDKERLARFEREAQLLAQLNHTNIAQIYGLETSGATHALVMELVPGPTLAERLESGPLSLTESLSFALQLAQALEEAHEKGIIHRDLKPQNIKASSEGKTKVLDFGLAKAMDAAAGSISASDLARSPTLMHSPTLTAVRGTELGVILGTAAYMAPEQAKGKPVDKRADIWAFGVVLYEMLTGEHVVGDVIDATAGGGNDAVRAAVRRGARRHQRRDLVVGPRQQGPRAVAGSARPHRGEIDRQLDDHAGGAHRRQVGAVGRRAAAGRQHQPVGRGQHRRQFRRLAPPKIRLVAGDQRRHRLARRGRDGVVQIDETPPGPGGDGASYRRLASGRQADEDQRRGHPITRSAGTPCW